MAILRSWKRTSADKDECPLCMGHRPDVSEPVGILVCGGNANDRECA